MCLSVREVGTAGVGLDKDRDAIVQDWWEELGEDF